MLSSKLSERKFKWTHRGREGQRGVLSKNYFSQNNFNNANRKNKNLQTTSTYIHFQDHVINARKVFLFAEKMGFELGDSGKNELKIGGRVYYLLSQFDQRHALSLAQKMHFNDYSKVIEYRKRKAIETKGN